MTKEIKALLLMQAMDEISDGYYPSVKSHGEGNWQSIEREIKNRVEELTDIYERAYAEIGE